MNLFQLSHPLSATIAQYLRELPPMFGTTGLYRSDYLQLIHGIIRAFQDQQEPSGAITDRYLGREIGDATPAYALGAALLAANNHPELLDSACRAMVHACRLLSEGQAPDNRADSFMLLLVTADRLLEGLAPLRPQAEWRAHLLRVDPAVAYPSQAGRAPDERLSSANALNLAGEFLRYKSGLNGSPDWTLRHLPDLLARFNDLGLYRDGELGGAAHSLAYDALTRCALSALLDGGFAAEGAEVLRASLLRGALSALFIQSPAGEWPGSGRGAGHTWNDAALAATYEWAARELSHDEPFLAGACKRGAHLALKAMQPFVRLSGELSITRNHFDPAEHHGFEETSAHSSQNCWAAAGLAFAYLFAEDPIPEVLLPSETTSYALDLGPEFHQVIAANQGMYVQVETAGDPDINPTGLVRVNWRWANPQIGPSEGCVAVPGYAVLGPTSPLTYAPAWKDRLAGWHSLAEYGGDGGAFGLRSRLSDVQRASTGLSFQVTWLGRLDGASRITASYRLMPREVRVSYRAEGPLLGLRAELPVFRFDGEMASHVEASERELTVSYRGAHLRLSLLTPGAHLVDMKQAFATRTGLLQRWVAEGLGLETEFSIEFSKDSA